MFCVLTALGKETWPKDMTSYTLVHTKPQDYYTFYEQTTTSYKDIIVNFVADIKGAFAPGVSVADIKTCDSRLCQIFAKVTGLTAGDYYLLNAFVDVALDPMLAGHRNTDGKALFGYSLSASSQTPFAKNLYKYLEDLAFKVETDDKSGQNKYMAVTLGGLGGFLQLQHFGARAHAAFTTDYGKVAEEPAFNAQDFERRIQTAISNHRAGYLFAAYRMLDFCMKTTFDAVPSTLYHWMVPENQAMEYSQPKLVAVFGFDANTQEGGFFGSEDRKYFRTFAEKTINIVQSSCQVNMSNLNFSDFRIVSMERSLEKGVEPQSSLDGFYNALRGYPFRTEYTAALVSGDMAASTTLLQKCTSIYNSYGVTNCADPSPPANWWVISLSIVVMIATILAWVYGCRYAQLENIRAKINSAADSM